MSGDLVGSMGEWLLDGRYRILWTFIDEKSPNGFSVIEFTIKPNDFSGALEPDDIVEIFSLTDSVFDKTPTPSG